MFKLQIYKFDEDDEDTVTMLGLLRIGHDICAELKENIEELEEIGTDGFRKERQARKEEH